MKVGDLVKWRYTKNKLYIVVSVEEYDPNLTQSVGLVCPRSGENYDMFISDLEVISESR